MIQKFSKKWENCIEKITEKLMHMKKIYLENDTSLCSGWAEVRLSTSARVGKTTTCVLLCFGNDAQLTLIL